MTEDRALVMQAVLNGKLSEDYLTDSEIDEIQILAIDLVLEQAMLEAEERGCIVFSGMDGGDTIQ